MEPDPARTVRDGYNAVAERYRAHRRAGSADVRLTEDLAALLPEGAIVLDAGCGSGMPIAAKLGERFRVVGLDFAEVQVKLAASSVPGARFACGDMRQLPFATRCFDGVCSYYAIIHVPREEHAVVLAELCRVLKPGGVALLCLGANDSPEWREEYLGTPMYWSHFDRETSLTLVVEAGFEVIDERIVADETDDGGSGHLFVMAGRQSSQPTHR